jgi:DegV family protein with EDD domain
MIKIITDTASDITYKQARDMDVSLVELPVTFGETKYDQVNDENFTNFYNMLETSKVLPVTSLASPGQYMETYEEAKAKGGSVVVIPLSSKLSGTYQAALMAKATADYDKIYVVDTDQAIIGQRLLVEYAVRLRADGKSAEEIAAAVSEVCGRIRLVAAVDTLKYLIMGGRLSKSAGMVGSALNIKPIVTLRDGAVSTAGKAKGHSGAINKLIELINDDCDIDPAFPFCFGYTKNKEQLDVFSQKVKDQFKLANTATYPIGGVIGTHVGPNVMAAVWVVRK